MRGLRERIGFGGLWAIASIVAAALGVFLLAFVPFVDPEEDPGGLMTLVVVGGASVVIGLAGVWLTVPGRDPALRIELDAGTVRPGGVVTGTLRNDRPGRAIDLAVVCTRVTTVGSESVRQRRLRIEAAVDPAAARQPFSIELPRDAPPTRARGGETASWFVVARSSRLPARNRVALAPLVVRRGGGRR